MHRSHTVRDRTAYCQSNTHQQSVTVHIQSKIAPTITRAGRLKRMTDPHLPPELDELGLTAEQRAELDALSAEERQAALEYLDRESVRLAITRALRRTRAPDGGLRAPGH
jgi:hypothetical protein